VELYIVFHKQRLFYLAKTNVATLLVRIVSDISHNYITKNDKFDTNLVHYTILTLKGALSNLEHERKELLIEFNDIRKLKR
jgi:hypothetical protein